MKIQRRHLLALTAIAASPLTFAQARPIRLIVPYAPGGPIDVTAFLDVINATASSSNDNPDFDYRRGVEVQDDSEAQPLIGLRLDYAW